MYIRWMGREVGIVESVQTSTFIIVQYQTHHLSISPTTTILLYQSQTPNHYSKMPTSHISTPLASVSPSIVIAALHNHDLMIKTLCPALISYNFESGDKSTCATYSITDRKPIGQVRPIHFQTPLPTKPPRPLSMHIANPHSFRQHTNSPSQTSPTVLIP
jgi:hypothetical protein